jgi:hypothetical protein
VSEVVGSVCIGFKIASSSATQLLEAMKEMMEGQIGSLASRIEANRKIDREEMLAKKDAMQEDTNQPRKDGRQVSQDGRKPKGHERRNQIWTSGNQIQS